MGIGIIIKSFAPFVLYLGGLGCALFAMGGNVRWALMLLIFLLPLRNFIDRIEEYPFGNQFIDILLLGVIVVWIVNNMAHNRRFLEKSFINGIAFLLILYTTISYFQGNFYLHLGLSFDLRDPRVQDWKNFCLLPVLFYVVLNNIRNKDEVKKVFVVICVTMAIEAYYTFTQISWHQALLDREKIRGTLQFLGPNELAAFFNQYTMILMTILFFMKRSISKFLIMILVFFNLYCITFLYSRGAYFGLIVGMGILFAIKSRQFLIPLLLILVFWQGILPKQVVERIKQTKTESGQLDESSQRRIDIWQQAIELFMENPVTGIGFGVFRHLGLDLGDTHNIYVKILTEQGMVGFIIFFALIFCFMREGFQLYQKGEDDLSKGLGLGFFISIFVLLINNFFGDRWSYLEISSYLWVFAGLVARLNVKDIPVKIALKKHEKRLRYYDI